MELRIAPDADGTALRASRHLLDEITRRLGQQERVSIALSGGSTPWATLRKLAEEDLPVDRIDVFQVDERNAPDGDGERNWTHITEVLLEPNAWPESGRYPMPVLTEDRPDAAARYEATLPDRLDLVVLGLGPDGHTASLIPGDPVCEVTGKRVAWTTHEERGHFRMTLTFEELGRADQLIWLITGDKKAEMLQRMLDGDASIPAGRVRGDRAIVFADRAAAATES